MEGMDISRIITGGAAGGILLTLVITMWGRIKASWHHLTGYLIQRVELGNTVAQYQLSYLLKIGKVSRIRDYCISGYSQQLKAGHHEMVLFEAMDENPVIIWIGRWPIFVSRRPVSNNGNKNDTALRLFLSFIRGTIDFVAITKEATNQFNNACLANCDVASSDRRRFFIRCVPPPVAGKDIGHSSPAASRSEGLQWYQYEANRLLTHTPDQLGSPMTFEGKALDNLFFPEHIEKLQHEIILWRSKRDWYRSKGLPWKRGWLFYGPPGTGKTALARSFAEDLDIPIFVFNLAEMSNTSLRRHWLEMQMHTPCIALIEDIDGVFHGRENITRQEMGSPMFGPLNYHDMDTEDYGDGPSGIVESKETMAGSGGPPGQPPRKKSRADRSSFRQPLTFDCLLNVIDGVERLEGVFTIITTNDITKIDEAIGQPAEGNQSTRPGRIDRVIELTYMTVSDKKRMAYRILKEYPEQLQQICDTVDSEPANKKETPSQFQERCAQLALAQLWKETHDKE